MSLAALFSRGVHQHAPEVPAQQPARKGGPWLATYRLPCGREVRIAFDEDEEASPTITYRSPAGTVTAVLVGSGR